MRSMATVLVAVGLLAAPGFGAIHVELQSGGMNMVYAMPGQTLTVDIVAYADEGLYSLSGDITASGAAILTSVPGSFAWVPSFRIAVLPGLIEHTNGQPGPNGGWTGFGSARTDALTNPIARWVVETKVASYQVQVKPDAYSYGVSTMLTFVPGDYGGWPSSTDLNTSDFGPITPLMILVPEPGTLGLLALGGLLLARRRRA